MLAGECILAAEKQEKMNVEIRWLYYHVQVKHNKYDNWTSKHSPPHDNVLPKIHHQPSVIQYQTSIEQL